MLAQRAKHDGRSSGVRGRHGQVKGTERSVFARDHGLDQALPFPVRRTNLERR